MDASTPRYRRTAAARSSLGRSIGWVIDPAERPALIERFPPAYPQVLASHVVLSALARPRQPLPEACCAKIVGETDDGVGLQCLVLEEIHGAVERWDGGVFHAPWSIEPKLGRRAAETSGAIAWLGWREVGPEPVTLLPARF